MAKEYGAIVDECANTRTELDTVLHPQMRALKNAFGILFASAGYAPADFKKLNDMVYYQGGYPNPTSEPKEVDLANLVAVVLKLEFMIGCDRFSKLLAYRGIKINIDSEFPNSEYDDLNSDDLEAIDNEFKAADIVTGVPSDRYDALNDLVNRGQELQREICQKANTIKKAAAAEVKERFEIKKPNFIRTVKLASVGIRKGEPAMRTKIGELHKDQENLEKAIVPLIPPAK